ncbi:MAG: 4-hydroxybenzoate octaprenyltransferase [Mariprofundaceae bacterium]|nr:4-hydroxybenzoate octaprenyltransferase [Mariprofundaceae bacterium]
MFSPSQRSAYIRLMRIDKPIGTYLVCWPMLWALWIAGNGHPDAFIVTIFLLGAFTMRSAGCVINDYADRHVDGAVKRTSQRPLVTGEIRPRQALILFATLITVALILVLMLNALTVQLAIAAAMLATLYPFIKRWSNLPQCVLGLAFAWSIPMAFAAVNNTVPVEAFLLFFATVSWVIAYDTMYAIVDRDDDLRIGVKSTAILFGDYDQTIILLLHGIMFALLYGLGVRLEAGLFYYLGLAGALALVAYQHYIMRNRERDGCFQAFLNNHQLGAIIFAGLFLDYAI